MPVSYQTENLTQFRYLYINQDNVPIDVSGATVISLEIYYLDGTVSSVLGSYSATPNKNLVVANTTIPNAYAGIVTWQFVVTLSGNLVWSPEQQTVFHANIL